MNPIVNCTCEGSRLFAPNCKEKDELNPRAPNSQLKLSINEFEVSMSAVPNIFGTRNQFCGRQFFYGQWGAGWGGTDGFRMKLFHLRSSGIRFS